MTCENFLEKTFIYSTLFYYIMNTKVLLTATMLSVILFGIIGALSVVFADHINTTEIDRSLCDGHALYWKIDCFLIIIQQNDQIIEKLNWNNCAMQYKNTYGYNDPDNISVWSDKAIADNYKELVKFCGEMP